MPRNPPRPRPAATLPPTVYLYVETLRDGSHRIAIGVTDETGTGHGYRVFGPKYGGAVVSSGERKYAIDADTAREIRAYLKMVPTPRKRARKERT